MYPFVESIRLQNGLLHRLDLHGERWRRTLIHQYNVSSENSLEEEIHRYCTASGYQLPGEEALYKVRVVYEKTILRIEHAPYVRRTIRSLRAIPCNDIDYTYKSSDRSVLTSLLERKDGADDILIIKNGNVTDASSSNVAFRDEEGWWTPDTPLLRGVMREDLLRNKQIRERRIRYSDLENGRYSTITIFNAMVDPFVMVVSINDLLPL